MRRLGHLFAILLMTAGLLLSATAASAQGADDPAQVEAGMAIFETNCSGCHGSDGMGSNTGRPLIDVAAEADREQHIASVTNGISVMPAFGEVLSAEEIESAVSYVRLTFVSAPAEEAPPADEPVALAETGADPLGLTVIGITMILGGLMLVFQLRREDALR